MATQPTDADDDVIARLSLADRRAATAAGYVVKVRLQTIPRATSSGWALYLNDFRVPKYWQYKEGIYFKVYDPQFLQDHAGQQLRFSADGSEFIDTGLRLSAPNIVPLGSDAADLPRQDDVLGSTDQA